MSPSDEPVKINIEKETWRKEKIVYKDKKQVKQRQKEIHEY